jgi:hypothetical protein
MRPRTIVAGAVLTAALALVALPSLAGSTSPVPFRSIEAAAFQQISLDPALAALPEAVGGLDAALRSDGAVSDGAVFRDPGTDGDPAPVVRPVARQPRPGGGFDWKPARYTVTGIATFYDHGTTAMRLPRGTVIRVCGAGGCLERVVNDYGPHGQGRVIDLYRPDFFAVCGCASWSGTTEVTVYVY